MEMVIIWLFFIVVIGGLITVKIIQFSLTERNPVLVRYHDGGRRQAGYEGSAGDCVTRSLAIATGYSYSAIYRLVDRALKTHRGPEHHPGRGVVGWLAEAIMEAFGGTYYEVPKGTYLRPDTIPSGVLIVWLKGHTVAVIDKVAYDTFDDPFRREMYGYWVFPDRRSR